MLNDLLILIGGFLGGFVALVIRYNVKNEEFKKLGNYIVALILAFAIYGVYSLLDSYGYIPPTLNQLALFGIAIFIGFSLNELAKYVWQLAKQSKKGE